MIALGILLAVYLIGAAVTYWLFARQAKTNLAKGMVGCIAIPSAIVWPYLACSLALAWLRGK